MTADVAFASTLKSPLEDSQAFTAPHYEIGSASLAKSSKAWMRWAGPLLSVLILIAVAYQLRTIDVKGLLLLLPTSIAFWLSFAAYYLAGPASEWVIFRRLWRLPVEGFGALLRKLVSNEILLGYLGEVYFYAWARRNAKITTAPFAAIKDVTILSALTGNAFTLVMLAFAAPLFGSLHLGMDSSAFVWSIVFVLLTSLVMLLFRKRLFALPRRDLWFVAGAHVLRIAATTLLAAVMWHLLLPAVALSWWLLLGTLRQLLSRLPFMPNKDIVFAGLASFLVGSEVQIVSAMALMASLVLGAHLLVGGGLGIAELARETRR
jgi:hypothetical protein